MGKACCGAQFRKNIAKKQKAVDITEIPDNQLTAKQLRIKKRNIRIQKRNARIAARKAKENKS